jgi:hypothetical protein
VLAKARNSLCSEAGSALHALAICATVRSPFDNASAIRNLAAAHIRRLRM